VVRTAVPVSAYAVCDLLERPAGEDSWTGVGSDGHTVEAALHPHQLRTLRLRRA
jgi:hypothetical protein